MKRTLQSLFLLLNVLVMCNGFLLPWQEDIPMEERSDVEESVNLKDLYSTLESISQDAKKLGYTMTYSQSRNCGKYKEKEAVVVDKLSLPETIVLGKRANFSTAITVNSEASPDLLAVKIFKKGTGEIPCKGGLGSCNYKGICRFLERVKCPEVITRQGWNCRCPFVKTTVSLPLVIINVPTVPMPAFLVDGTYFAQIQMFQKKKEIFCFQIKTTVKKA